MKIHEVNVGKGDYYVVDFDKDELRADNGELVPYAFSAGTIQLGPDGKIKYKVWMPATYVPARLVMRDYKVAAKKLLETAAVLKFGRMK